MTPTTPPIVLGAMNYGTSVNEATAFRILDRYVDEGGSWIDTANCYSYWNEAHGHGGQSESTLGRWLAERPGMRERVKIATKVGCEPITSPGEPFTTEGLSAATIADGLAQSLRRLGTDHVDLFWAHRDDRLADQPETVAAFSGLVTNGKALGWGYSNTALWRVERARGLALAAEKLPPTALQLRYSYLQPRPFVRDHDHDHRFGWVTDDVLDYVDDNPEIVLWAYSPLLSGAYDRADRAISDAFEHPGTTRRLSVLSDVAQRLGISRTQLVTSWLSGGTPRVLPIIGASTVDQLDIALRGSRIVLPPELRKELDAPW
ncbi:aldo/keto reductase [Microbacterium sp. A93]|uniref:aldo/keto reductase n=1 Tax=Microbacterium sp. A93 TaxID=3450716 RepID=UPI003F43D3CF